ncbi:hypothetical protein [Aerolutibacter ruishenii]|uniref:Uncharacterized protein n=1 Tax=Aerolutibacter ruishenii TaxID=686800 RepID=A0A562M187_9GAMM|nr:hypothetical protein [Lysobacter ruishenii]TWI13640.1 hypothetical protein IP93_00803 [Lysobacter ruishenii]
MSETLQIQLDAVLLERIRRVAQARGWSDAVAIRHLVEHGLFAVEPRGEPSLNDADAGILQSAIAALEGIPDDPGFSLIGRASGDQAG